MHLTYEQLDAIRERLSAYFNEFLDICDFDNEPSERLPKDRLERYISAALRAMLLMNSRDVLDKKNAVVARIYGAGDTWFAVGLVLIIGPYESPAEAEEQAHKFFGSIGSTITMLEHYSAEASANGFRRF